MTASNAVIREAKMSDCDAIAGLAAELRAELGDPEDFLTAERLRLDGFGQAPEFAIIIAELDGKPVGYALFTPTYEPAFAARGLYLADLYVRKAARRRGIARALIDSVCDQARQSDRTFVWLVSDPETNTTQRFYDSLPDQNHKLVRARAILLTN